ncbi:MAG: WYL domain-containing protein [Deltaproteobacteria bacterium]|nr:MAG: WYL domain-containing protein [Deltaproteobacteria bacterium]
MRDVNHRLRRLLFLVPYVARHPDGVPVDALAALVGVDRDQLLKDLDLLTQVGPPDGDPGEYLLVSVEEGRVFVDLAQRLTRPLRLTPAEGCSLLLGVRALRESGIAPFDDALASAEHKLKRALGRDAPVAEQLATGTVVSEPDRIVARHLRDLVTAARTRRAVTMHYGAVSSGSAERRTVDPYGVVHHAGQWYVVGHCHKRGDTRTFRIDRISSLEVTDARFTVPPDFDLEAYRRERLYVPSADAVAVRVHLDPVATARVGAAWPHGEVTRFDDGSAEIVIDCEGFEWVTGWVLGFGRHAWIVEPDAARAAMAERVERMRAALAVAAPTGAG